MPIQARPIDEFTRDNLLMGLSSIEFEPALSTGGFGPPVLLGILSSQALQKEVELLKLERGDSGTLTVDREFVSKIQPSFSVETFNMRADVARFVFGSDVVTQVTAEAAAAITNDPVTAPLGTDAIRKFLALSNADLNAGSYTATGSPLTAAIVANVTGDGTTIGDYRLRFKVGALGDMTLLRELTSAGVLVRTFVVQAGAPSAETEVEMTVGLAADSGDLHFFQAVAAGNTIEATYTPSLVGVDDDNTAVIADYFVDGLLGRTNFRRLDTFLVPDALSAFREGQSVDFDYTYDRKAHTLLQAFRQNSFDGRATVRHLTDKGINFIWPIPSASIRITDDDIAFSAEDLATATLVININDAGGSSRFGTIQLSDENQAAA